MCHACHIARVQVVSTPVGLLASVLVQVTVLLTRLAVDSFVSRGSCTFTAIIYRERNVERRNADVLLCLNGTCKLVTIFAHVTMYALQMCTG
jgi:hypothetical protein